ncbi:N-acetyl-D-glucosamine kinase isoform X2 [Macrosteles quadrilineatus]|uniref:N-acetyl-D-glucosamine kinase isoform X2 n=1 Tax=Macrosteles quadrilineatus TaxID=74068 RepID=UPI0023E252BE|nr:N-acetyl-D-glucosamine kinase isoform X2 [Macrosteles quadrilineatus]
MVLNLGGASGSCAVLYNEKGEELAMVRGPHTNHWLLGLEGCHQRLQDLVVTALKEAKVPPSTKLNTLGLSLSGCEGDDSCEEMKQGMAEKYPNLSEHYVVWSDTVAPVIVAHEEGGVVLISGTGTNALLINPDGSQSRCGGWGFLLGDEGGAFWIAHKLIKVYIDEQDKLEKPPKNYSTQKAWECVQKTLMVKDRFDLLPHFYRNFEKSEIAGLTKEFADVARQGDPLCQWAFSEAGRALAKHLLAISPDADKSLLECEGGLPVVCVGSVWRSWDLLKPGFLDQLNSADEKNCLKEASLIHLKTSVASGATYLAAKTHGYHFPRNHSDTYEVFFHYVRE